MELNKYCLKSSSFIIDAIECIENNNSRCAIVINSHNKVIGVVSEGDIIRLLLDQVNLKSPLKNIINKSFKFLKNDEKINEDLVLDFIFKGITLIPIINDDRELIDVIISSDFLKDKIFQNK